MLLVVVELMSVSQGVKYDGYPAAGKSVRCSRTARVLGLQSGRWNQWHREPALCSTRFRNGWVSVLQQALIIGLEAGELSILCSTIWPLTMMHV